MSYVKSAHVQLLLPLEVHGGEVGFELVLVQPKTG